MAAGAWTVYNEAKKYIGSVIAENQGRKVIVVAF